VAKEHAEVLILDWPEAHLARRVASFRHARSPPFPDSRAPVTAGARLASL
jgi:hypothetical protein